MTYVVPGNPDGSLLMQKLRGTQSCGLAMPLKPLGRMLTDGERMQVATWIQNGAMND